MKKKTAPRKLKQPSIFVRVTPKTHALIKKHCQRSGQTIGAYVELAVQSALSRKGRK